MMSQSRILFYPTILMMVLMSAVLLNFVRGQIEHFEEDFNPDGTQRHPRGVLVGGLYGSGHHSGESQSCTPSSSTPACPCREDGDCKSTQCCRGFCCSPGESCIQGFGCCGANQACFLNSNCNCTVCCPSDWTCVNNACCLTTQLCGDKIGSTDFTCCKPPNQCINNVCCPATNICGTNNVCCSHVCCGSVCCSDKLPFCCINPTGTPTPTCHSTC